jgi:hydrogenase expression/formation protein HypD
MKYASEFRDRALVANIASNIAKTVRHDWTLMEFCGTHTVAIFRHGLRSLLPDKIRLVSGPGCPVCVTPTSDIDKALSLCGRPDSIVATYGDLIKVPGSTMNLAQKRAAGADVRVVYSSYDALEIARQEAGKKVFFIAIGFETTAPATAAAVKRAAAMGLENFSVLCLHKLTPPVVAALLERGSQVQGFLCPGHVSAIIGARPFEAVAGKWGRPCVIAGFEPGDVLQAILMLVRQLEGGRSKVEVEYSRGVPLEGNERALSAIGEVFEEADGEWRGLGLVKGTGLRVRSEYSPYDASRYVDPGLVSLPDPPGCRCGDVLRGDAAPPDCSLFAKACSPDHPVGPCMVSSEGTCAAYYLYSADGARVRRGRAGGGEAGE